MDRSQLMRLILEEKLGDDPHFTLIKPIKFNIRGYKKSSNEGADTYKICRFK